MVASLVSAIVAGTIMTLFTWVVAASDGTTARILASFTIGFILAAPSLNHAVVGFAEMSFGIFAGTAHSEWGDLARTVGLAIAGNLIGGIGLVFSTRLAQVRGDPRSESGRRAAQKQNTTGAPRRLRLTVGRRSRGSGPKCRRGSASPSNSRLNGTYSTPFSRSSRWAASDFSSFSRPMARRTSGVFEN